MMIRTQPSELPPADEFARPPPWLISFVDLVSLLLSFMILVFAAANLENKEWSDLAHGIRTTFGGPAWMAPDPPRPPTQQPAADLPTLDLGYLAVIVEARLGGGPKTTRVRRDGHRLRIALPLPGTNPSPLRPLGAILGRVGNAITIDVRVPSGPSGGAPSAAEWETALNAGIDVAAALVEGGVSPGQLAVFARADIDSAPDTATSGLEIVVLDHRGHP